MTIAVFGFKRLARRGNPAVAPGPWLPSGTAAFFAKCGASVSRLEHGCLRCHWPKLPCRRPNRCLAGPAVRSRTPASCQTCCVFGFALVRRDWGLRRENYSCGGKRIKLRWPKLHGWQYSFRPPLDPRPVGIVLSPADLRKSVPAPHARTTLTTPAVKPALLVDDWGWSKSSTRNFPRRFPIEHRKQAPCNGLPAFIVKTQLRAFLRSIPQHRQRLLDHLAGEVPLLSSQKQLLRSRVHSANKPQSNRSQ